MARSTAEIELVALVDEATKTVKKFAADTQKQLSGISFASTVTAINAGLELVQKTAGAAFNLISDGLKDVVNEAIAAEEAQLKLANALRLSGDYSAAAVASFNKLASEIQRSTTFTDEQVLSAAAVGKQFSLTNAETQKAVRVAADLAAVTGQDLNSAMFTVSQTFSGFVSRDLAKTIPGLKNLSQNALISGQGLSLIESRVKGSAEALGNTFAGALTKAGNALSDIKETLGGFITDNPALIAGLIEIRKGFELFNDQLQQNGQSFKGLVTDGFLLVISAAPKFVQTIERIFNNLSFVKLIVDKLGASLGALAAAIANPLSAGDIFSQLSDDLDALDEKFGGLINGSEDFFKRLESDTQKIVDNVNKAAASAKKAGADIRNGGLSTTGIDQRKLQLTDIRKQFDDALKSPFTVFLNGKVNELNINPAQKLGIAAATSFLGAIVKGAQGARDLISNGLGAVADALIPGIGGAVASIVGELSQGPQHVKDMVNQFVQAIPAIVQNIILAIPSLVESLIKAIPQLVKALVDAVPQIVDEFIKELPSIVAEIATLGPTIAITFTESLVKNIPKIVEGFASEMLKIPSRFAEELIKSIPGVGGALGGGGGGGGLLSNIPVIGGFLDSISPFATGGRVPNNPAYKGDKFPARLDAGEQVFSGDLTSRLEKFLDGNQSGQQLVVNLTVGQQQLARAILDLNRGGFRTA